jgi:hypothetical protein
MHMSEGRTQSLCNTTQAQPFTETQTTGATDSTSMLLVHTAAPTHTATLSLSVFLSKSTLCTQYTTAKYRTTVQYPIAWPTTQLQGKNATSRHERTVACWLADCYSWLLDLLSSSWGTSDTYKQILFLTHNSTHGCASTTQNLARYCENPDKVL